MAKTKRDELKRARKAQARIDREAHFAQPGAKAIDWLGGRATVETDRRKEADRTACRGRWEE